MLEGIGGTEEKWGRGVGVDAIALLRQKGIRNEEKDESFEGL